jgi:hypothetical protein
MAKNLRLSAIPVPKAELMALLVSVSAIKQALEVLIGSVGDKDQRAVTFVDLVNMGLILPDQIPGRYDEAPSGKILDG